MHTQATCLPRLEQSQASVHGWILAGRVDGRLTA